MPLPKLYNGLIMEHTWYLYILRCKDDTLYTGITTDVEKRLNAHRSGKGQNTPEAEHLWNWFIRKSAAVIPRR